MSPGTIFRLLRRRGTKALALVCGLLVAGGLVDSGRLGASTIVYYVPERFPEVCAQNLSTDDPACVEGATESVAAFCDTGLTGLDLARDALGLPTCSEPGGRTTIPGVDYVVLVDDRNHPTDYLIRELGDAIRDLGDGPMVFPTRSDASATNQVIFVGERFYRQGNGGRRESDSEWQSRVASLGATATTPGSEPIRVFLVDPRLPTPSGAREGVWGSIPLTGRAERLRELCGSECPTLIRTYEELTDGRVGAEVLRLMSRIGGVDHIEYILVSDSMQDLNQATIRRYGLCQSEHEDTGRNGVWPCAWRNRNTFPPVGRVGLGELHGEELSQGGRNNAEWDSTLIHETIHTLDRTNWDTKHYGAAYGPDGDHYFDEILPDPNAVFMEGFANFAGMQFAPSVARSTVSEVTDSGWLLMAEEGTLAADAAGQGDSGSVRLSYVDGNGAAQTTTYYYYRWRSLDAESLLRNERIAAVALYYIAANVNDGYEQLLGSFRTTNWRSRTLLTLIGDFVAESDWEWRLGVRDDAAALFALSIVDILTHFDFSDGDFRSALIREAALDEAVVDEYLGDLRPRLRSTVREGGGGSLTVDQAVERAKAFIVGDS